MKKTAIFIDGNFLLHKCVHAIGKSVEEPTRRVPLMFLGYVSDWALKFQARYVAVCFDGSDNFRYRLWPSYKSSRGGKGGSTGEPTEGMTKDEIYVCMAPTIRLLEMLGIRVQIHKELEADDLTASGAFAFTRTNEKKYRPDTAAYIIVPDKDSRTRIDKQVFVYRPPTGKTQPEKLYTKEIFKKETGMNPRQFIDYQILCGDRIDDIPSIVTPSVAKNILKTHGTLYKYLKTEEGKKFFRENRTAVVRNRGLAVLDYLSWKPSDAELLLTIKPHSELDIEKEFGRLPKSFQALRAFAQKRRGLFDV